MTGVETRHSTKCPKKADASKRCNASGCSHRAYLYVDGKVERSPRFTSVDEAKSWRINRQNEIAQGVKRTTTSTTLQDAWDAWAEKAKAGTIRTRSGGKYKPSTLRGYAEGMARVLPDHGNLALSKIDQPGLQRLIGKLISDGRQPSTVRNTVNPLRSLYRDIEEIVPGGVSPDPTVGLRLPSVPRGARTRVSVAEVKALVAALKDEDKPLWSALFFAGLRIGEARALRWKDVDFVRGVVMVPHGWDREEGRIDTKSESGNRETPLPADLRAQLEALKDSSPNTEDDDLVFGRKDGRPFNESTVAKRADRTWKAAGLTRMTRHEARHAYAALMLGAGTSLKALSEYMGHSSITITSDKYGYLLTGTEAQDAAKLDALLDAG